MELVNFGKLLSSARRHSTSHKDAFVRQWVDAPIWLDEPGGVTPVGRTQILLRVWELAGTPLVDVVESTGLSVSAFAERYEIPRQTLANWLKGVSNPPVYARVMLLHDVYGKKF